MRSDEPHGQLALAVTLIVMCGCGAPRSPVRSEPAPRPPAPVTTADKDKAGPPPLTRERALARELTGPLLPFKMTSPDGLWAARAEAHALPAFDAGKDSIRVTLSIGTAAPIECTVFREPIEAAGTIANVLKLTGATVDYEEVTVTDVTVASGSPALFVQSAYVAKTDEGPGFGQVKAMVHARRDHPVLCLHDEPGYVESFRHVALGFSGSILPLAAGLRAPQFADVLIVRVGERPVGFTTRTVWAASDHRPLVHHEATAVLLPGSPMPMFQDTVIRATADSSGFLQRGTWIAASDGAVLFRVEVERGRDGAYTYTGQRGPETLEGRLDMKGAQGLVTQPAIAAQIATNIVAAGKASLTVAEYHPSVDATRPLAITYTADGANPAHLSWAYGDIQLSGEVDRTGWLTHYATRFGGDVLKAERIWASTPGS